MLTLVLADAELERVPEEIAGHAAVRSAAKRRGRPATLTLLDSSVHHAALRGVDDGERRGRPDIVHLFLLLCLDSIPNLEGALTTVVHTRGDRVIRVDPATRLPKNYPRFVGLMEDLFEKGAVPEDRPLLRLEQGTLADVLRPLAARKVALVEGKPPEDALAYLRRQTGDVAAVVGGFPHGTFRSPVADLVDETLTIHAQPLKAWTVAATLLSAYGFARRG